VIEPLQRILVIGGGGFIGSHLCRRWLDRGASVDILVHPETALDRLPEPGGRLTVHRAKLDDRAAIERCLASASADIVYHLATSTGHGSSRTAGGHPDDIENLARLLEALSGARHTPHAFIRSGSIAEYGRGPLPFREEQQEQPLNSYALMMTEAVRRADLYRSRLPFPVITARLALAYGRGQSPAFLIPSLISRCLAGKPSTIDNPNDRRDLIHVDDVVDALRTIAEKAEHCPPILNICTGIAPTIREVAQFIRAMTGASARLLHFGEDRQEEGPLELRASPHLMDSTCRWQAAISWRQGIAQTIEAFARAASRAETTPAIRQHAAETS